MIHAIIPMPLRVQPGTWIHGCLVETVTDPNDTPGIIQCGRNIAVPPLYFYKIFSVWNRCTIEHVFASPREFNPITLVANDGNPEPVLLYPISVRYSAQEQAVFLFIRSAGQLLQQKFTLPIQEVILEELWSLAPKEYYANIARRCHELIVDNPDIAYTVASTSRYHNGPDEYADAMFEQFYGDTDNEVIPAENIDEHHQKLYVYGLMECGLHSGVLDPITSLCIKSTTALSAHYLIPYLEPSTTRLMYSHINMMQIMSYPSEPYIYLENSGINLTMIWSLYIAVYMSEPTDIMITINATGDVVPGWEWNGPTPIVKTQLTTCNWIVGILNRIINTLRTTALRAQYPGHIRLTTFIKRWTGEIYLILDMTDGYRYCLYSHEAIAHLISPTLSTGWITSQTI